MPLPDLAGESLPCLEPELLRQESVSLVSICSRLAGCLEANCALGFPTLKIGWLIHATSRNYLRT